jgi:hypothetical protein
MHPFPVVNATLEKEISDNISEVLKLPVQLLDNFKAIQDCNSLKGELSQINGSTDGHLDGQYTVTTKLGSCYDYNTNLQTSTQFQGSFFLNIKFSNFSNDKNDPNLNGEYELEVQFTGDLSKIEASIAKSNLQFDQWTYNLSNIGFNIGLTTHPSCSGTVTVVSDTCQVSTDCQKCTF